MGLAGPRHPGHIDVQVKQLAAKLQGGLSDLLNVTIGPDRDLNAEHRRVLIHAHTPYTCGSIGKTAH